MGAGGIRACNQKCFHVSYHHSTITHISHPPCSTLTNSLHNICYNTKFLIICFVDLILQIVAPTSDADIYLPDPLSSFILKKSLPRKARVGQLSHGRQPNLWRRFTRFNLTIIGIIDINWLFTHGYWSNNTVNTLQK